jgi:hypothetical protein
LIFVAWLVITIGTSPGNVPDVVLVSGGQNIPELDGKQIQDIIDTTYHPNHLPSCAVEEIDNLSTTDRAQADDVAERQAVGPVQNVMRDTYSLRLVKRVSAIHQGQM